MAVYPITKIKSGLSRLKNNLRNLKDEQVCSPVNFLRVAGIFSRRVFTGPLKVCIDITDKCDMGCLMCWYHSPVVERKEGGSAFIVWFKEATREA